MRTSLHLIVGLGKTGHSIARYLRNRKQTFLVFDTRLQPPGLQVFQDEFPGVDVFLGSLPDSVYTEITEIICSPGVSPEEPFARKAVENGIPIIGDIECFAREVEAPIVAITGTNGKSTVTTLVGEMAQAAGLSVAVAGNIGVPVLDRLDDATSYDLWVLELSSFQLDLTTSLHPKIATILNITPDHLDRYHHLEAYIASKQRIYQQADRVLYNRDDIQTAPPTSAAHSNCVSYGSDTPKMGHWGLIQRGESVYLAYGDDAIVSVDDLRIKGRHNWQNALAASALATAVNVPKACIVDVLQRFTGLPHRTQWVRTLDQVDWINDSKGTNIGATISAISGIGGALQGKIVLIAGGQGKGADFTELRSVVSDYVRSVVLIGEDADKLECALADLVPLCKVESLEAAVSAAKTQAQPGDVVLLSPACASLDMFSNFEHRGRAFVTAVQQL